jgi:TM2 domain-containing membrane protein YozV
MRNQPGATEHLCVSTLFVDVILIDQGSWHVEEKTPKIDHQFLIKTYLMNQNFVNLKNKLLNVKI